MAKQLRIRGVRRKKIDEDQLALAFLLLSKTLHTEDPEPLPTATGGESPDQETKQ